MHALRCMLDAKEIYLNVKEEIIHILHAKFLVV